MKQKVELILEVKEWTQQDLAEHLDVSQSSVNRWLTGSEPRGPLRDAINELYESVADQKEISPNNDSMRFVPIMGLAGAGPDGAVLYAHADGNFGEIEAPRDAAESAEALEVRGNSMYGTANDGYIIFYEDKEPPSEKHIGNMCVCFLEDDRVLVKFPQVGSQPGLFHLESVNAPMMRDIPVRAFAIVTDIKTRYAAQKFARRNPQVPIEDISTTGIRLPPKPAKE